MKEGGEPRSEADDGDMWVITAGGQRTRSPRETEGEKRIADDASVGGKPRRVGRVVLVYEVGGISARLEISVRLR